MARNKAFEFNTHGNEPFVSPDVEYSQFKLIEFFNWYNYMHDGNDARKFTKEFCKANKQFTKYVDAIDAVPVSALSTTTGWLARLVTRGMKMTLPTKQFMIERLETYLTIHKEMAPTETVVEAPVKSVRDRMIEKSGDYIAEVEGVVDDFINNGYKAPYDVYQKLSELGVKGAYVKYINTHMKPYIKEINTAIKKYYDKEDQIAEGYRSTKLSDLKLLSKFLSQLGDDLQSLESNAKKSRKPRKKKLKPATKQVSKLKYMERYDELHLVSEPPEKLVGAKAAFIFNTKNNQLSMYVSRDGGFQVQRSSIKNWDENQSQVKRFSKGIKTMQTLDGLTRSDAIKAYKGVKAGAADTPKGRINENMIIVKVY